MSIKDKLVRWAIMRWLDRQVKEGTVIGKVWTWFDGKKTVVGTGIALLGYVVAGIPLIAPLCDTNTTCIAHVATASGIGLSIVGLLHKAYKFIYKTDAPNG